VRGYKQTGKVSPQQLLRFRKHVYSWRCGGSTTKQVCAGVAQTQNGKGTAQRVWVLGVEWNGPS
jgi:hypothetical protein